MRAHSGAPTPSAHVAALPSPNTPNRERQRSPSTFPHSSASDTSALLKPEPQQQSGASAGSGIATVL